MLRYELLNNNNEQIEYNTKPNTLLKLIEHFVLKKHKNK